jgi:hypothetical protein
MNFNFNLNNCRSNVYIFPFSLHIVFCFVKLLAMTFAMTKAIVIANCFAFIMYTFDILCGYFYIYGDMECEKMNQLNKQTNITCIQVYVTSKNEVWQINERCKSNTEIVPHYTLDSYNHGSINAYVNTSNTPTCSWFRYIW